MELSDLDTHPDGTLATSPLHAQELEHNGYQACRNPRCDHMHGPEVQEAAGGNIDANHVCQHCSLDQKLFKRAGKDTGGGTNAGISMDEQSQIGEDMVQALGEIPGYGKIAWWQKGPAAGATSALDGATLNWGIEVKTYNWANEDPRGKINSTARAAKARAISDPNLFAKEVNDPKFNAILGQQKFQGLLGILVLLDFMTDLADIYGHAMPKDPVSGMLRPEDIGHVTKPSLSPRYQTPLRFVIREKVPFTSSLPDPRKPGFVPHYQQKPQNTSDDWGF